MPALRISNDIAMGLPGLGERRPLEQLSEKRITSCVRENLRVAYGGDIKVSCSATYQDGEWYGACRVDGQFCVYTVSPL